MPSRKTILIVDDDPDIRDALSQLLQDEGYDVAGAADGAAALAYLREAAAGRGARPCLILLDLMMPGMNGWEFRAEQRRDPAIAGTPVVVITAGGSQMKASSIDAAGFLAKPIDIGELTRTIEAHCR